MSSTENVDDSDFKRDSATTTTFDPEKAEEMSQVSRAVEGRVQEIVRRQVPGSLAVKTTVSRAVQTDVGSPCCAESHSVYCTPMEESKAFKPPLTVGTAPPPPPPPPPPPGMVSLTCLSQIF